jgi:hypothetical protein
MSMAAHFFYLRFFFKARQFWLVVSSSPTLVALSLRRLATSAHTLTRHFGPPGTAAQALAPYRPDLTTVVHVLCSLKWFDTLVSQFKWRDDVNNEKNTHRKSTKFSPTTFRE